ncbi:MAG: hypothetical protein KatS3mg089_0888 [Patescibacteria group bacterium]|nr:MAG: hypothetical protein KatS3mg089_0888 [Patescibacteria group bacterium]
MPVLYRILTKKQLLQQLKRYLVLLLVLLLILPPFSPLTVLTANAGTLSNAKVLINNSQASATNVSYNFRFTTPATTAIGKVVIQFCTTASGSCTTPTGMTTTGATRVNDNIAGTGRTDTFTTNGTISVDITTPAAQSAQNVVMDFTGITNPSTTNTSHFARITTYQSDDTTVLDTATVAFATLDTSSIAVSATVDPTLTFTVAGVTGDGSATVNGATITNGLATTATTIPFGTLTVGTPKIAAHDVTITTNAVNGYTVTASHSATSQTGNPPLVSGTSNNIDSFTGTNASPTTWSSPAGTSANVNTGFFGYTTEDTSLCTGTANRFSSNKWAGTTTTGEEVICSTTGVSSQTTRVGWQVEVNNLQPAGSYTGTVILIATPTY